MGDAAKKKFEKCVDPSCKSVGDMFKRMKSTGAKENTVSSSSDGFGEWEVECPPGREEIGRSGWNILHATAHKYPEAPTPKEKQDFTNFFNLFQKLYPCGVCREELKEMSEKHPFRAENKRALTRWVCEIHNEVNKSLKKPVFPCDEESLRKRWERNPEACE